MCPIGKSHPDIISTYYHIFDSKDDPRGLYAQNFMPYINIYNNHLMDNLQVLIKYSYDLEKENIKKTVTYKEEILKYDSNEEYEETIDGFDLIFYETENSTSEYKSYKLLFNFSNEYATGHFDFQVFLEINGDVLPFYGVYNYPVREGSFITVSDEKISPEYEITKVYWKVNYYDENDTLVTKLYKENFQ